jgi:hypothetical protein
LSLSTGIITAPEHANQSEARGEQGNNNMIITDCRITLIIELDYTVLYRIIPDTIGYN